MITEAAVADAAANTPSTPAPADAPVETMSMSEAKKIIAERDKWKAKAKELEPTAAELQAIKDKDLSESQRLAKEVETLAPKAKRAEALEAQVQAILDTETASLTEAQKAAIVGDTPEAKLAHLRALQAAGMIARPNVPPVGANLPGAGGAGTVTQTLVANTPPGPKRDKLFQDIREGRISVVPG